MEIRYIKWLELNLVHQYFSDRNPPISLVPTRDTKVILERNDVLIRQSYGLIEFHIGSDSVDFNMASELENLGILEFELIINDLSFFNYTDLSFIKPEEYYMFWNTSNSSDIQVEKVSSEDPEKKPSEGSIGFLQINVNSLRNKSLNLSFNARKVLYQYKIITANNRNFEIIDINIYGLNNEKYAGPYDEVIIGSQKAKVFTSPNPLHLSQTLAKHPVLKLQYKEGSSIIKEMELNLPNPSPELLSNTNDGQIISAVIVYV